MKKKIHISTELKLAEAKSGAVRMEFAFVQTANHEYRGVSLHDAMLHWFHERLNFRDMGDVEHAAHTAIERFR